MKKLIYVIPITILIYLLLSSYKAHAAAWPSAQNNVYMFHGYSNGTEVWGYGSRNNNYGPAILDTTNRSITLSYWTFYSDYSSCLAGYNSDTPMNTGSGSRDITNLQTIIVMKGSLDYYPSGSSKPSYAYDSKSDYEDSLITPTPTPTPIPSMWDKFYEWYYKIYGYYPADDSLFGYFRSLFDEDQESSGSGGPSQHSISTHRPPPTPTPTPIPYSVIIQPVYDTSGNVVNYTYNYSYTSESGETIIVTSPPDNSGNCNCNDDNEPYNPDPLAVPTSALDAWYMFAYDENEHPNPEMHSPNQDFDTGMKFVEDNINEYDKPIDYIMSAVNSIPDDWLMLFGIGIGLIFIAGVISRFLS